MKLSTQADYAVRAVYELARHEPGAVLHTGDIAAAQHIPGPRLAKVIHDLARADLVRTQRGHQGGVMLARPAGATSPCATCTRRWRVPSCCAGVVSGSNRASTTGATPTSSGAVSRRSSPRSCRP